MELDIKFFLLFLTLLMGAQSKPTFGLLEALFSDKDEGRHNGRPEYYGPAASHGPLIQEGYDYGYSYGGHGYAHNHGMVAGNPYAQSAPVHAHGGYYPAPVYYPAPQHQYAPTGPGYGEHSYGGYAGGYKQQGY